MRTTEPTPGQLDLYYTCWCKGFTDSQIFAELEDAFPSYTLAMYKKQTPYFFTYTRLRAKRELSIGVFTMEKTQEIEDTIVKFIRSGVSIDKAASALNIPLVTILSVWFVQDPVFKAKVDHAREIANAMVVHALFKRATGFKAKLRSKTTTKGGAKKQKQKLRDDVDAPELNDGFLESETIREELVLPSVEAIKFWLINNSNGDWSLTGETSGAGSKSKILEAIDDMTKLTDVEREEIDAA